MSYYSDEEWSDSDGRSGSRTQATSMTRAEPRARIRARREEPFSGNTVSSTESAIDNHDKYRMGAPGTLLPLPLENSPIVIEDALTRAWVHIRLEVIKLLQKREIEFQNMSIVHRHLPNTTPDKVKTLLVTATASNSSDSWILFLDDCHTLLAVGLEVQDFKIEIIDPRAVLGKLIYPIGLGDDIIEIWPLLRPRIHRELDGKDWRAIQVMKMGYMIPEVTPAVTIILTVSNMFDLRWVENLKKIDEILQESPYVDLDLKLHLIQGSVNWQIGRPTSIVPQQFQQEVSIGSSIGPDSGSGTLGLYIKTSSSSGAMKILGLTNCHVIRTEFLTQSKFQRSSQLNLSCLSDYLKDHDEKGFVNTDLKNPVNIFSPSLMDKERSVETQQAHAEDLNIPIERLIERAASGLNDRATKLASLQERREKCLSNIKMISEFDCSFGVVEVASGLRHGPMNCSIDWALVDPKQERIPGIPNSVSEVISTEEKLRF